VTRSSHALTMSVDAPKNPTTIARKRMSRMPPFYDVSRDLRGHLDADRTTAAAILTDR
jgi:hypothetical protein